MTPEEFEATQNPHTATGEVLDKWCALLGIERDAGETDESLRDRAEAKLGVEIPDPAIDGKVHP